MRELPDLIRLPSAGEDFRTTGAVLTCVGRYLARPGVVRARHAGSSDLPFDVDLTAGQWSLVQAA
jgi:hypothetical protein